MYKFATGNVVKWKNQLWVVAQDDGDSIKLIPMNFSNSSSHPSKKWPTEDTGRVAVKIVSDTIYGWLIKNLIKNTFGIEESLSANGWTPR